jgi:hypothetical protein
MVAFAISFYLIVTSMAKYINMVEGKPLLEIYNTKPEGEDEQ